MRFGTVDRQQLLSAFLEAFADYVIDVSGTSAEIKRIRAMKNHVDWDLSPAVFDGDRMVAFTLVAVDDWQGEQTAFDAATGIVPAYRGRGLAGAMLALALPELRRRGVRRFALEVISTHEPAIRAYRKAGFEIARRLSCWSQERPSPLVSPPAGIRIERGEREVMREVAGERDWRPSFENRTSAIARVPGETIVLAARGGGETRGAIAYASALNWILGLVVRRDQRRSGIGTALLAALWHHLPPEISSTRWLNVDAGDAPTVAFLERAGFRHELDQYEMSRSI